jgi:hypothetical protein
MDRMGVFFTRRLNDLRFASAFGSSILLATTIRGRFSNSGS